MAESPKVGSSVLVGLMAFVAVTAWVAMEVIPDSLNKPRRVFEPVPTQARLIPASDSLSPNESHVTPAGTEAAPSTVQTASSTPVIVEEPSKPRTSRAADQRVRTVKAPAPAVRRVAAKPPAAAEKRSVSRALIAAGGPASRPLISTSRAAIIVEERRLTQDERIELDVMDRLASNRRLSGKIGVESRGAVVRLTGWTRTVGQARRAERDARSVPSVRQVRNEIRPRVGGFV